MRSLLLGLVLLVWLILGYFFHQKNMECCSADGAADTSAMIDDNSDAEKADETTAITPEKTVAKATGPILYNYGNNTAILGDDWNAYKSNLLSGLKDGDLMEITGRYTADEKAPLGFANMGEARADEARKALGLAKDKVTLKGVISNDGVDKNNPYEAVSFKTIASKKESIEVNEDIGVTNIRFPYNSTNKLSDRQVEDYLDKVAKRVNASGERIKLVGHTDSRGDEAYNKKLGQQRADIIKRYLISKGVSSSKITTSSQGESSPIASNSTESGRQENRRTELTIIK